MKAVSIAHACPPVVAGALFVLVVRSPETGSLMENAIEFYMYVILDI